MLSGDVDRVTSSEASTTIALWFGVDVLIGGGMRGCLAANPFDLASGIRLKQYLYDCGSYFFINPGV